jgi:hypothetical protein
VQVLLLAQTAGYMQLGNISLDGSKLQDSREVVRRRSDVLLISDLGQIRKRVIARSCWLARTLTAAGASLLG